MIIILKALFINLLLGQLEGAYLQNLTDEFLKGKNEELSSAFHIDIHDYDLPSSQQMNLTFLDEANQIIIGLQFSRFVISPPKKIISGVFRIGFIKNQKGKYIFLHKSLLEFSSENLSVKTPWRINNNSTAQFTVVFKQTDLFSSNRSSLIKLTGLPTYNLLKNQSCRIDHVKMIFNNSNICINRYDKDDMKYLIQVYGLFYPSVPIGRQSRISALLFGKIFAFFVVFACVFCFSTGVIQSFPIYFQNRQSRRNDPDLELTGSLDRTLNNLSGKQLKLLFKSLMYSANKEDKIKWIKQFPENKVLTEIQTLELTFGNSNADHSDETTPFLIKKTIDEKLKQFAETKLTELLEKLVFLTTRQFVMQLIKSFEENRILEAIPNIEKLGSSLKQNEDRSIVPTSIREEMNLRNRFYEFVDTLPIKILEELYGKLQESAECLGDVYLPNYVKNRKDEPAMFGAYQSVSVKKPDLQNILNRKVDDSIPFIQQIHRALCIRNENIQQIREHLLEQELYNTNYLSLCDKMMRSNLTVAVVGRINSGKSMFVSALLDWDLILPSSEEITTSRITRIVYSEIPVIRRILIQSFSEFPHETILSEDSLNEDLISDYVHLYREDREDLESLKVIIEIGIPSPLLAMGVSIIDYPGLDENETTSYAGLKHISYGKPLILCYLYDWRRGFTIRDGQIVTYIVTNLKCMGFEGILIANKCDFNFDSFDFDFDMIFNQHQENDVIRMIMSMESVKISFELNIGRMLPAMSLSTGCLFLSQNESNIDDSEQYSRWKKVQNVIAMKIISQARSLLLAISDIIGEENLNLKLHLKALTVEEDLIELITTGCSDDENLLVDFTQGYKIFGLIYNEDQIHVTQMSSTNYEEEKQRIQSYWPVSIHFLNQPIIFEYESITYWIEKRKSHKRLIDHLNEYSLDQLIYCMYKTLRIISSSYSIITFRPDNIYVNDDRLSIDINSSIPNDPRLPFVFKDQFVVKPFHIYSRNMATKSNSMHEQIYSFGWLIWIMIHGGGIDPSDLNVNKRIEFLEKGRFPNYPEEINKILMLCFKGDKEDQEFLRLHSIPSELSFLFDQLLKKTEFKEFSVL